MSQYLIDSDWIIEALNGQERITRKLEELAPEGLYISAIAYGEVYQGAYYSRSSDDALKGLRSFLNGIPIVDATAAVAERFALVRGGLSPHASRQIGDLDLLIAATAIEYGLVLLANNVRHFGQIPGLSIFSEDGESANS